MFFAFPDLQSALFQNPVDATLSSLGNPRNMQIRAAIAENDIFVDISVAGYATNTPFGSNPMFWGVENLMKLFVDWLHQRNFIESSYGSQG